MLDQRLLAAIGGRRFIDVNGNRTDDVAYLAAGCQNTRREQIASEGLAVARFLPSAFTSKIDSMTGQSRTAAIGANTESCVVLMGREALDYLDTHELKIAQALHRGLSRQLAKQLSRTTTLAHALLRG